MTQTRTPAIVGGENDVGREQTQPTASPSRRQVLRTAAAGASLIAASAILKGTRAEAATGSLFTLGVASGNPAGRSVVLWTRLAPDPLNGGGLPSLPIPVRWEVATDPGMVNVIRAGTAWALAVHGHAVHVLAAGLPSDSWLYYRFYALGEASRIGRTRTFPRRRDAAERMRFAVVSCQNYEQGFYPAWSDMAALRDTPEDIDFVVDTGDYIYEGNPTSTPIAPGRVHNGPEIFSVDDYRNRYALYKLDPHLQDAHAAFPFIDTFDDHETDNNYAAKIPEETAPFQGAEFLQRRRNAYRVYAETMPLRLRNRIGAPLGRFQLYRRLHFGNLADIHVLDTRQFRTDQPAADLFGSTDPDSAAIEPFTGVAFGDDVLFDDVGINDPNATMLEARQEAWLARGLGRSRARWNVIAQQVMVTEWNLIETAKQAAAGSIPPEVFDQIDNLYNVDAWDGYRAARQRLFDVLARVRPNNPVVVTGDIHSAWAANLLQDFGNPNSDILAAEFVCTSIASTFLAIDPRPTHVIVKAGVAADNPHIPYFNGLFRGYSLCDVTAERWQTTYRAVGDASPGNLLDFENPVALVPFESSPVETDAIYEIAAGFNAPNSGVRIQETFRRPLVL